MSVTMRLRALTMCLCALASAAAATRAEGQDAYKGYSAAAWARWYDGCFDYERRPLVGSLTRFISAATNDRTDSARLAPMPAWLLADLASAYAESGDYARAADVGERAVASLSRDRGPGDQLTLRAAESLAGARALADRPWLERFARYELLLALFFVAPVACLPFGWIALRAIGAGVRPTAPAGRARYDRLFALACIPVLPYLLGFLVEPLTGWLCWGNSGAALALWREGAIADAVLSGTIKAANLAIAYILVKAGWAAGRSLWRDEPAGPPSKARPATAAAEVVRRALPALLVLVAVAISLGSRLAPALAGLGHATGQIGPFAPHRLIGILDVWNFGDAVILAPVAEELLFRRVIYSYVRDAAGPGFGIAFSSALFAAAHLRPGMYLDAFGSAVLYAYLYEVSGGVAVPIASHSLHNALTFFL